MTVSIVRLLGITGKPSAKTDFFLFLFFFFFNTEKDDTFYLRFIC